MSVLLSVVTEYAPIVMAGAKDAATASEGFADAIRNFIGPIFLLCIGIAALTFLFQRQMTQFIQFIILAVVIALLLYWPEFIKDAAMLFKDVF